ncbi:MAG: acetate kinase [Clostridia bacterium]|nr:acetate kinase [Clostridia bacterium]
MKILVINAGSSSLKYQLIDMDKSVVMAKGLCDRIGIDGSKLEYKPQGGEKIVTPAVMRDHSDAIKMVLDALVNPETGVISSMSEIGAVGHRVVHGGENFSKSVVITPEVKKVIEECSELAPLHNPANIIGIEACEKAMPGVPNVAVFDTAFHQTMLAKAYMYALPYEYYEQYKIRRYGFHGTSHKFVSQKAAELAGKDISELKIITCHLGNGSSVAAIKNGKVVDTSMGFTPLAGLPMGTRCGDIDPAIVTYLAEKTGKTPKELDAVMNEKSGMLGVSGKSSDYRDLEAGSKSGDERCALAFDMFNYSLTKIVGGYIAAMNGVDVIAFTGGLGENNGWMRKQVMDSFGYIGVEIDDEKNNTSSDYRIISTPESKVKVMILPTDEEMMIAIDTKALTE